MAALHRALFTWFSGLLFLIFLGLRLDGKTSWDWFVVFTPMWFFDSILLFYVSFRFAAQCRSGSAGCGQVNGGGSGGGAAAAAASAAPSTTSTSATASSGGTHSRRRNDHITTTFTSAINAGNVVTVRGSRSSSNAPGRTSSWLASVALKSCFLVGVLLKMIFQAAVCVTLQYPEANVPLRYVFVPLWLLLAGLCIGVFRDLIHMCRY